MGDKYIVSFHPNQETKITQSWNQELGRLMSLMLEGGEIEVSDGHHTMDELYEHRIRLYLALVKIYDNYITPLNCQVKCWKSRVHDDGSSYEGWFLLGMTVTRPQFDASQPPTKFDISYHIPDKYWHLANVIELDKAPPYDGYTSQDVLERLLRL